MQPPGPRSPAPKTAPDAALKMRRIGLLGGMSWESTALYYRLLNEGVSDRLGGLHSADCVVVSLDFAAVAELQAQGRWDDAGALLAAHARELQAAGADLILLCTNTMHKVAAHVEAEVDVPLLHIIDVTAGAARDAGFERVGLLATRFTMEQPFYADRMSTHGIDVITPDATGRDLVHRVIYDELCRGVFSDDSRQQVHEVIGQLADRGAQAVILGCTELELLVDQASSALPVLATTALHATAALDAALA